MSVGTSFIAVGGDTADTEADAPGIDASHADGASYAPVSAAYVDADWEEAAIPAGGELWRHWLIPVAAFLAVMAWTNIFVWANYDAITSHPAPAQWLGWVSGWSGPVVLVALVWMMAARSSPRAATRFAEAARGVAAEAGGLETRLTTINAELSLAREFIAAQARDIDALGRVAVERLGQHGDRLATLIRSNGAEVEAIGGISAAALANMEALRGQLPVIATMGRDVGNAIGNAGRLAQTHLDEMVAGFERLNQFGAASERQVESLRGQIDAAIGGLENDAAAINGRIETRIAGLAAQSTDLAATLDRLTRDAEAGLARRADAMTTQFAALREAFDGAEAEQLSALRHRLAGLDREAERIGILLAERAAAAQADWHIATTAIDTHIAATDVALARQRGQQAQITDSFAARNRAIATELEQIATRVQAVLAGAEAGERDLREQLDGVEQRLTASRAGIDATGMALVKLTNGSVRLLELIQASVQHGSERLPAAIGHGEERLAALENRAIALRETVNEAGVGGDALSRHVLATREELTGALRDLGAMQAGLDQNARDHARAIADARAQVAALATDSEAAAAQAEGALIGAIDKLAVAARGAVVGIETDSAARIADFAERLGAQSTGAIDAVMRVHTAQIAGELEAAATHAAGVSREAAVQLRNQLAKVNELVGHLERRVAQARDRAEEQVDGDFARRVALITESLNSHAIDVAKALDSDVSDTAWAAYLRGDRGVFTRRAVRLLDAPEAKAIAQIYENDSGFHDAVSHYIHDFEAMLRQLLSTRDGHALGVTLLSSDMGKLYVALAQAIERLRG